MFDEAARRASIPFYWLDVNGDSDEPAVLNLNESHSPLLEGGKHAAE
jgi:hypothetical protein